MRKTSADAFPVFFCKVMVFMSSPIWILAPLHWVCFCFCVFDHVLVLVVFPFYSNDFMLPFAPGKEWIRKSNKHCQLIILEEISFFVSQTLSAKSQGIHKHFCKGAFIHHWMLKLMLPLHNKKQHQTVSKKTKSNDTNDTNEGTAHVCLQGSDP